MTHEEIQDKRERGVQRERRYQSWLLTIATGAILGGGGWAATTLLEVWKSNAVIKEQVSTVQVQVSGAYRSDAARKDFDTIRSKIDVLNKQNEIQDTKIENLDRRVLLIETNAAMKTSRQ